MIDDELERWLTALADDFIRRVRAAEPAITEGWVRTVGPPAYRRLDCHGRALAYVRVRAKKRLVRADLSPRWTLTASRLVVPAATGAAVLLRSELDLFEGAQILALAVRP